MALLEEARGHAGSAARIRREASALFERLALVRMPRVPFEAHPEPLTHSAPDGQR
jgi:hypothetical protein